MLIVEESNAGLCRLDVKFNFTFQQNNEHRLCIDLDNIVFTCVCCFIIALQCFDVCEDSNFPRWYCRAVYSISFVHFSWNSLSVVFHFQFISGKNFSFEGNYSLQRNEEHTEWSWAFALRVVTDVCLQWHRYLCDIFAACMKACHRQCTCARASGWDKTRNPKPMHI